MTELLRRSRSDAVLRLTLSDDATRNSLSETMMAALTAALDDAAHDLSIGAIVIAASGKVFCSGHNLKELTAHRQDADKGVAYFGKVFGLCSRMMLQIAQHRCAVIAEVDGLASAAGCQLVATCDLAYGSAHASFCTPGVNIGLFCSTPMVSLSRNVPSKLAMEMLLLGEVQSADFAFRAGLINAVVGREQLSPHVMSVASTIAAKSQQAIRHGKRKFYEQLSMPLPDAYELMSAVMVRNMLEGSACEGIDAFVNKRNPQWPTLT